MEMNPQHGHPTRLSWWFLLAPVFTAAFLWIGAMALIQGAMAHGRLDGVVALLLIPAALAVLGAPGYGYAFFNYKRWGTASSSAKAWIQASLVVAALAAGGAIIASIPTGFGPILSLWSLVMAVKLIIRFRKES